MAAMYCSCYQIYRVDLRAMREPPKNIFVRRREQKFLGPRNLTRSSERAPNFTSIPYAECPALCSSHKTHFVRLRAMREPRVTH